MEARGYSARENFSVLARNIGRRCTSNIHTNTCEKPIPSNITLLAAVLGGGGLVLGSITLVLIWLHCRRKQRDRKENFALDDDDINDYVLDELENTNPDIKRPNAKFPTLYLKRGHYDTLSDNLLNDGFKLQMNSSLTEPGKDPKAGKSTDQALSDYSGARYHSTPSAVRSLTKSHQPGNDLGNP